MSAAPDLPGRPVRYAGLDGLRAIAVVLVIAYHVFPGAGLRSGFIGVDVFFVISGFLITSILLREPRDRGRFRRLVGFWRRRARRLIPALAATVLVCTSVAWIIGGDVLVRIGPQVLSAVTFTYNWNGIAAGGDYFDATAPELFRNLWSLAVEEQFYLLWPLVLPLLLLLPYRMPPALALAGAVGSAVLMGAVVAAGGDPTRAYFGTDSHAFGILIGIALAFFLQRMSHQEWMTRAAARIPVTAVGALATAGIVALALLPDVTRITFPFTMVGASVLTAVAIAAAVWPGSPFGRAIDLLPMRWVGHRSYSLYLWHWPVLVLATAWIQRAGPEAGVPVPLGLAVLAITVACAAASYALVEQPVRRLGFRGAARAFRTTLRFPVRRLAGGIAGVAVAALATAGTVSAVASEPQRTSAEQAITAGQKALEEQKNAPEGTPPPTAEPEESTDPDAGAAPKSAPSPGSTGGPDRRGAVPAPSPTPVSGSDVTAIGDSVMLASAAGLLERMPGIDVDAEVSRSMWSAAGLIADRASAGTLREHVVIALGTNGPIPDRALDEVLGAIGPDRRLILVNASAPRDWIPGVNETLRAFAAAHPRQVIVADWQAAVADRGDLLAGDQIHPSGEGGRLFAETVAGAVQELENRRAQHAAQLARSTFLWESMYAHGIIEQLPPGVQLEDD